MAAAATMTEPRGPEAAHALDTAVQALWAETGRVAPRQARCSCGRVHPDDTTGADGEDDAEDGVTAANTAFLRNLETTQKLTLLRELLTVRPPDPFPSPEVLEAVETALRFANAQRPRTNALDIPSISEDGEGLQRLALWKGDITTLAATAIVNAANSELLGCFRPEHPCIDNAIHAVAGPRLRQKCCDIVDALPGGRERTGSVQVTPGYLLPSEYVLHTVGPIVRNGSPSEDDEEELRSCYNACLEAAEDLEATAAAAAAKTLVFCGISTGMFGYPAALAVGVAVDTVMGYFAKTQSSTITKVIFNVFTPADLNLYLARFRALATNPALSLSPPPTPFSQPLQTAVEMLRTSDALLIAAGAGLSASYGLDYTSHELFRTHFSGTAARTGARCLYELFGHAFTSERDKWGYYFSHLSIIGSWPLHSANRVYDHLITLTNHFDSSTTKGGWFVRTSNADGLFRRHGFLPDRIATPQGDYSFMQCARPCSPDSVFPAAPFLAAAKPFLDLTLNTLSSDDAVPKCPNCNGSVFLCVRADHSFSDVRFRPAEKRYREFLRECREKGRRLTVLEIGVGWNTPSVARWPSEELVQDGAARLVRVGIKGSQCVPWELDGVAVGVEGDAGDVVRQLLEGLALTTTAAPAAAAVAPGS